MSSKSSITLSWHDEPGDWMCPDWRCDVEFEFAVLEASPEDGGPTLMIDHPNHDLSEDVFGPCIQITWEALIDALEQEGWDRDKLRDAAPEWAYKPIYAEGLRL